jgi:hypothetical protein
MMRALIFYAVVLSGAMAQSPAVLKAYSKLEAHPRSHWHWRWFEHLWLNESDFGALDKFFADKVAATHPAAPDLFLAAQFYHRWHYTQRARELWEKARKLDFTYTEESAPWFYQPIASGKPYFPLPQASPSYTFDSPDAWERYIH